MFSGMRGLGESQETLPDWYGVKDAPDNDIDLISVAYLSPDASYPPQRISNYDVPLAQHQTLNGVGMSRLAATFKPLFTQYVIGPRVRLQEGAPRGETPMTPRYAPPSVGRYFGRLMRR